ncbi:MAG: phosphoribosylformylglycinamidine synthase subunit PurS [Firmicutes bacterium]|nr:phosphoribosylformylglycinamidine synthase subunit PurS [Bacillota bacterium]
MNFRAFVRVSLKKSILDPQGDAVRRALLSMGYDGVADVRVGKHLELLLSAPDEEAARDLVDEVSRKLLANPVTEVYEFDLQEESGR